MTREEIEKIGAVGHYCFKTDREKRWYEIGCIEGLAAADEEPKENSKIAIVDTKGEFWIIDYFSEYFYERGLYGWDFCKENYNLKIWAYIDDLLPKGCKK